MENKSKYIVVTHFYATGPAQFLTKYFISHDIAHWYIEHPFIFSNRDCSVYYDYLGGKKQIHKGIKVPKVELLYYLKDFIATIISGSRNRFEIGFGFDNLNTLALLLLKKLRKIEKVVYVTVDYTPKRFTNKVMNLLYHAIDKYCCYNCDILWDSAKIMRKARKDRGVRVERIKKIIVVPDGNDFRQDKIKKFEKLEKYKLVYMGHVRDNQGIDLLIKVAVDLQKYNKKITLLILGGGEKLEFFKKMVKEHNAGHYIKFTGYIEDHKRIEALLRNGYLGFALYEDDQNSFSKYSAVGKPMVYMGCGLPVIITDVPEIAQKIEKFGSGKIVKYKKDHIVQIVKEIIKNEKTYRTMREKAISFAKMNTWDKVFSRALGETTKILKLHE